MACQNDCKLVDIDVQNKVFDMVLNLNMLKLSEEKGDLELEIDNERSRA